MVAQVYVINSGKGGVGKTTTTANVATALALKGRNVLMIDADIGLRNLDVITGPENRIVYDLVQAIEGDCEPKQAAIRDKNIDNLHLIPAAQTRDKDDITAEQMQEFCDQVKSEYDYIFIDSPAGIEQGFRNALFAADKAIVVTTPEVAAIRDADRVIGFVEANGKPKPEVILNRVRPKMVKQGDMMNTEDILGLLSVELLGVIPEDENIVISTNRGVPIVHNTKSKSAESFRRIAARIEGQQVPILNMEVDNGIFSWIRKITRIGSPA